MEWFEGLPTGVQVILMVLGFYLGMVLFCVLLQVAFSDSNRSK